MAMYSSAESRPPVRAATLWAGGAAAAVVAAGVAIVGFLIVRGLLDLQVLGVERGGAVFEPSMAAYAVCAALAALAATALMHLLLLTAPRPRTFFGWIVALATAISMIVPLTLDQPWEARLATAAVNLAIGLAIGLLVSMSARSAVRPAPYPGGLR
ncbi:hypothetical protein K1W54_02975 [Micromonospora sp. CPCC 205371]|nr:hypothetical protein [Micromonospora sp. CPCC 205371]